MTASREGPESTQLKFREKLKADLLPPLQVEEDIRGIRQSPVIPADPRKPFHHDDTRRIADSHPAKHRYGRSKCPHEAKFQLAVVGWPNT